MFRDYKNYDVCEDGRIWSKKQKKFLKPQTTPNGYQQVCLTDNEGKQHRLLVHRVTWIAVNGREVPDGYELNHLDEDKTNCAIWNISCCSHKENMNFGTRNSRAAKARINHPEMSKRLGAFKDDVLVMVFPSTAEAGRNGYCHTAVAACCRNCYIREGNNKYKGFTWKYLDDN